MVLKADQERVKTLLKDTITLLCRNGLTFKSKFSIEALIGVTLDDSDVFLVSINELIQLEKAHEDEEHDKESESSEEPDSPRETIEVRENKKRSHAQVKRESSQSGGDEGGGVVAASASDQEDDSQLVSDEPSAKRRADMKQEADDDMEDIVFIKQEPKEMVWQQGQDESMFSDMANAGNSSLGSDQNFPSLADVNLVPIAAQDENSMWNTSQANQMMSVVHQRGYRPRGPRSSTVTGTGGTGDVQRPGLSNQDTSQMACPAGGGPKQMRSCDVCGKTLSCAYYRRHRSMHGGRYPYRCPVCGKGCGSTMQLEGHMSSHTGVKGFRCHVCGREFSYKNRWREHLAVVHRQRPPDSLGLEINAE